MSPPARAIQETRRPSASPELAPSPVALTTGEIAALLGARLVGPGDIVIDHLEMFDRAGPRALCFVGSPRFAALWSTCSAGAAIVAEGVEVSSPDPAHRALLFVPDIDLAMAALLERLAPAKTIVLPPPGVHDSAIVDPTAQLGAGVAIGPRCIVGAQSRLGDGVVLAANVTIGAGVAIGRGTVIHSGASILDRCAIGQACIIHPGVMIGTDGFGYRPAPDGSGLVKIPHIGTVEIGDGVEIGANSCIDRAKFGATTIGSGTKIDNLVQIAHNCRIGRACILCGQVGLAGSVVLGDGVVLGGAVGIADHITIGAGARVAARSGVMNDIPAGETWMGLPAAPAGEASRNYAAFRRLADMMQRLRKFERALNRT